MSSLPPERPSGPSVDMEARFAWLERHVAEQDKVILELDKDLRRLSAEVRRLSERAAGAGDAEPPRDADERPPHY